MPERALGIAGGTVQHIQSVSERKLRQHAAAGQQASATAAALRKVPEPVDLLRGIHVSRVFDVVEQLAALKALPRFLRAHPQVHLLVVDSVAYHFRRGFPDMAVRARMLTGMAQELLQLANEFNLVVVVTNQVGDTHTHAHAGRVKQTENRSMPVFLPSPAHLSLLTALYLFLTVSR
jgi:RAD51-like protein 2